MRLERDPLTIKKRLLYTLKTRLTCTPWVCRYMSSCSVTTQRLIQSQLKRAASRSTSPFRGILTNHHGRKCLTVSSITMASATEWTNCWTHVIIVSPNTSHWTIVTKTISVYNTVHICPSNKKVHPSSFKNKMVFSFRRLFTVLTNLYNWCVYIDGKRCLFQLHLSSSFLSIELISSDTFTSTELKRR